MAPSPVPSPGGARSSALTLPPGSAVTSAASTRAGLLLSDVVAALRRRWKLVAAFTLLAGLGGGALAAREHATFTATAVVRVGDARRVLTSGLEAPDQPLERLASPFISQVQLLRSRTLIGAVVDSVGLRLIPDYEGFRPRLLREVRVGPEVPSDSLRLRFTHDSVHARFGPAVAAASYGEALVFGELAVTIDARPQVDSAVWTVIPRDQAIDALLGKLKAKPRTQTNIVDVAYSARRPSVAQRVVNAVATEFQSASAASARDQSRRRRAFLEEQLRQNDAELVQAQQALDAFRRQVRVYGSSDQLRARQQDLDRLDERLGELEAEQRMYGMLLAALSSGTEGNRQEALRALMAAPGVRENPAVAQLYVQLTRLRATRDSLTTGAWRSADSDPDVQRTTEMIRTTENQLVGTIRGRLDWLDAQRASLAALRVRGDSTLGQISSFESEELRLAESVAGVRRSSERLREDYQKARMAEAVELGPVEVVDYAALPYEPDSMLRVLKLALVLLLGLGAGGALAVFLESRNRSIRFATELEEVLQLPGLGLIPRAKLEPTAMPTIASTPSRQKRLPGTPARSAPVAPAMTEAYRVLRTNLLFSREANGLRSLVVTSTAPAEGKTVTSMNLAASYAAMGMRVLLIDCDLRRGRLHHIFRVPRSPGLTEVLEGAVPATEAIHATATEGLSLLAGGAAAGKSGEALRSTRMLGLIRTLADQFDLLILDTPPVLAVADASVIAALADGVLLVVRAGQTSRTEALMAVQQLDNVGARLLGAVLNDATDMSAAPYRYYAAYHETPALAH